MMNKSTTIISFRLNHFLGWVQIISLDESQFSVSAYVELVHKESFLPYLICSILDKVSSNSDVAVLKFMS